MGALERLREEIRETRAEVKEARALAEDSLRIGKLIIGELPALRDDIQDFAGSASVATEKAKKVAASVDLLVRRVSAILNEGEVDE